MKVKLKKECNEVRFRLFGKEVTMICDDQEIISMSIDDAVKLMRQLHEIIAMYIAINQGQNEKQGEKK